jgi:hypothetical protein
MQVQIVSAIFLVFVNANEDSIMVDDVVMPNPPVAPIEEEKLEEASFDMNVSQRSQEKELSKRMVRIQVDYLAWDCRLYLNPHVVTIYLEFVHVHGAMPKRFEEC